MLINRKKEIHPISNKIICLLLGLQIKKRMINTRNRMKPYSLLIGGLALLLVGCSSTRQIKNRKGNQVYQALGLHKESKDNFALYKEAASWLNVPHRDGGLSANGIDCSGLVHVIYKNVYHKTLERNSSGILQKNCERIEKNNLMEGDLVFFDTSGKTKSHINHTGIYLKNNKFLHSSTSRGVIVSDLEENFYRKTWICGGRVKNSR